MATNTAPLSDHETRQRLLEAAARLFAEQGFQHVTVRDICKEAGANVAAVNYYFRDKWGLYQEVIQSFVKSLEQTFQLAHTPGAGATPEVRFRHYVRVFMQHVLSEGQACFRGRLMAREMADPSPALDLIIDQAIRPNSIRVAALVGELMGLPATDSRVGICVGSIQTQITGFANPIAARMIPGGRFTPEIIESIAQHVADFSLGGMRAIGKKKAAVKA